MTILLQVKEKRGTGRGSRPKVRARGNSAPKSNPAPSKPLGGSGIPKAIPAGAAKAYPKGGLLGLAGLLFFGILFDDQGLSDGTLPDHLRQPGETQDTEKGTLPPWYGGQNPAIRYRYRYEQAIILNGTFANWKTFYSPLPAIVILPISGVRLLINDVNYGTYEHWGYDDEGSGNPAPDGSYGRTYLAQVKDSTGEWKTVVNTASRGHKVVGFEPPDGSTEADPYAGVPGGTPATKTKSTTNNNAPTPERATADNPPPPSIRPPLPRDRTAKPTPSSGIRKPSSKNYNGKLEKPPTVSRANNNPPPSVLDRDDKRARVELPSAVNTPAPEPPPPQKKTIGDDNPEAGKVYDFGELPTADADEEDLTIISERIAIRADGTKVKIKTREATPEEMEKFNKDLRDANRKLDNATEVVEKDRKFRLGNNYDGGIDTNTDIGSPPEKNKNEVEEEERISPGKIKQ